MSEWLPAATKGRLDVDVITLRRALADGLVRSPSGTTWKLDGDAIEVLGEDGRSRGRFAFMLLVRPDGDSSPYLMLTQDCESVRSFLKDMEPHSVRLRVAGDESEESLSAALRGEVH